MSFQKRLKGKDFVVLAEMHMPKGVDVTRILNDARRLKGRVDAVVVPGMDNGIMRLSALGGGVLLQQQGLETIIHVYCRDRNRIALQGDLLAAHVLGVQNLLVVPSADMAMSSQSSSPPMPNPAAETRTTARTRLNPAVHRPKIRPPMTP